MIAPIFQGHDRQDLAWGHSGRVTHPSCQARTCAALIRDFNVEIQERDISLRFCAYLHNCRTPVFLRNDGRELAAFLKRFAGKGDRSRILYRIEHVRPRPSRNLAFHQQDMPAGR